MSKPLSTTLGDALANSWRADLRANDINRRPPPSSKSGPDRGFIEQPNERRPEPPPRRRTETPTLTAPVALIRPQVAPQPIPNSGGVLDELLAEHKAQTETKPPKPSPAPEKPARQPGKHYTAVYRTKIVHEYRQALQVEPHLTQKAFAERHGIHQTLMSNWLKRVSEEEARAAAAEKRRETLAAKKAENEEQKTLLSRPQPPSDVRTFEVVSRELAEAIERVKALKRELRALLGDE
jgi:hypothetical protein